MKLFDTIRKRLQPEEVYAHCDVPCGIYDPHLAQVAAHTVVRMVDMMAETMADDKLSESEKRNKVVRLVNVKEEHAELAKHEVRIIWGDYFKEEHLKEFPDLHTLVWTIMKLGSKARQTVDTKVANDLLDNINTFAEIFWKTKGKANKKAKAPYPTEKEIVLPA
jgi:nickel superoxide dismutase